VLYQLPVSSAPHLSLIASDAPRPDYGFIDDLREFISLRLDKVNPYKESKEYCLQQEKASRLYEKLKEMLSEEGWAPRITWRWRCWRKGHFWMGEADPESFRGWE